jgi:hypothetical protein
LPRPIRRFAKPVCDLPGTDALGGFNEGLTRPLLGPGYFILRRSDPAYLDRGAWVVDYLQVPDGALVAGWPRVVPTSTGWRPHRLVYGGTRDYMRRVCEGVTVGLPWKGEARLAFPFTLVRVPLAQLPGPR